MGLSFRVRKLRALELRVIREMTELIDDEYEFLELLGEVC
jgi:hypothetical protein